MLCQGFVDKTGLVGILPKGGLYAFNLNLNNGTSHEGSTSLATSQQNNSLVNSMVVNKNKSFFYKYISWW